jgi:hypothetical protein
MIPEHLDQMDASFVGLRCPGWESFEQDLPALAEPTEIEGDGVPDSAFCDCLRRLPFPMAL